MEEVMKMDGMQVEIVQEFTGRYMKITTEERSGDFGAEVLRYNKIEGMLGAQIQQVDNMVQYYYEIGDRISLSELLRREQFTVADVKSLMTQLIGLFENAKEYFLDEKDVVLMSECIFYEEKTQKIFVPYLDGYGHEVGKGMSRLLEACIDHMNHEDKELVFLLYGLHKISKEKNFCISRLAELVGKGECQPAVTQDAGGWRDEEPLPVSRNCENRRSCIPHEPRATRAGHVAAFRKQTPSWGKIAAYVVAGFLVFVSVCRSGILGEMADGTPYPSRVMALAMLLLALVGSLVRKEWTGSHGTGRDETDGHGAGARGTGRYGMGSHGTGRDGTDGQSGAVREVMDDATTLLDDFCPDETVVLDRAGKRRLYVNLIPEDWQREEIKIRKSPFFIGKNAEKADGVIREGEISRIHAKVVIEENDVFVIDQESTNGTYVNGTRLIPWERKRICREDKIGFSSVYYRVEMDS